MREQFIEGLIEGLKTLWQPWFMTGVRNGGFEQTLRNVCLPEIEKATGLIAFTENEGRADATLVSDRKIIARLEFKINFAQQRNQIKSRIDDAISKLNLPTAPHANHRIYLHVIVELVEVMSCKLVLEQNQSKLPKYKKFHTHFNSCEWMEEIYKSFERGDELIHGIKPISINGAEARLHVWVFEVSSNNVRTSWSGSPRIVVA